MGLGVRARLAGTALALVAVFAAAPAGAAATTRGAAASPHVAASGDRHVIVDGSGRELLLRGVNSNALVQYPDYFRQTVPLRRADFDEMGALGFNFLRLPISWSLLEPRPDRFSRRYLRRIARAVALAESRGMRVLVDFHQDRYNRNLRPGDEADGAPDWATLTDGKPCEKAFFLSPCSQAAYDHFWNDTVIAGKPLQQHYLEAMLAVSRLLRHDRALLGLELMNEPTPGSLGSPRFEREQLWPFYRRMIAGLRADGERRMLWFGPSILRDVIDFDPGQPERFSSDGNLVYAPHIYTGTFNGGGLPELKASFAAAEREARAYGAAWVDAEWGGGSGGANEPFRQAKLDLLDSYGVGSGFWMWKQRPGFYNWQTVEVDGSLRGDSLRAQQLSRPHVDAVPGRLLATSVSDGALQARIEGGGGRATVWSGTVIRRGGESLIARPYVRVAIDGRPVPAWLSPRRFATGSVSMYGYRVGFTVPPGTRDVRVTPAG